MTIEVKELRTGERYVLDPPVPASFGAADVTVADIGYGGLQICHPLPIRIGSTSRLAFHLGNVTVATSARMLWSHLWKVPNSNGKTTYRSGLHVDDQEFAAAVRSLIEQHLIRPDNDSLDRKRKRLLEKERERSDKHLVKALPTEQTLASEQLLLIQHARERLRSNPLEAARLYQQARTADAANGVREEVVVVWEYLERTIPLPTITRVFEGKG